MKQADYDVLKEGLKDPVVSKLKYMEVIGDLYGSISISQFKVHQVSNEDPIGSILSKFTAMAEPAAAAK